MSNCHFNSTPAFTIVELLVVIVVIGILAAITIVSYTGISSKATVASLQSDLDSSSRLLKMYQVEKSAFPSTVSTDCVAQPDTTTNKCLKSSNGNTYEYYVDNTSNKQTYCITATKSNYSYSINETGAAVPAAYCPVLYLDAGNKDSYAGSGTTWKNLSGFGNNAVLNGGVTYNNANGGALVFDGINGWASIPDSSSLDLVTGVTIEAWINPTSGGGTWYGVLSKGNAQSYALTFNNTSGFLHFETPANNAINSPVGVAPFNVWTYVVATFDGLTKNIYVNGNLSVSGALVANLTVNNEPLRIGQGNDGEFFKGKIANVGVYSRALSILEIQQKFNSLRGRYGL